MNSTSTSLDGLSISSAVADGCDTLQPPTRRYFRRSATPGSQDERNPETTINATSSDSENEPGLTLDVFGLHAPQGSSSALDNTHVGLTASQKAKGKAKETQVEDWLQPPGRKLCSRHQRMADEGTNLQLQKTLDDLPYSDREAVSHIWSSFSSSSHKRRALILQGVLTMCCESELDLLTNQLRAIKHVDPFAVFPKEISLRILLRLDAKSLTRAAQVSRRWHGLADDNVLWKNMCEQHIQRKCRKCGWGLPLLERRAQGSGANSPTGAGASAGDGEVRFKRPLTNDEEGPRPAKRARSNPPEGRVPIVPTSPVPGPSSHPPRPNHPAFARMPSTPSPLRPQRYPSPLPRPIDPTRSPLAYTESLPSRLTRPWKDVYSERLTIARNWKLGRSNVTVLKGHTDGVMCIQYNDKLQHPSFPVLISGSYDRTVRVWNAETGQEVLRLLGHTRAVRALQFDECKLVTGSMDHTLRLWNWRTGQCIRTLEGHSAGVVCLAFDSNVLVSGSVDRTVKVWNFRTGDCFTLRGHVDWVNSVKIWDRFASVPNDPPPSDPCGTAPSPDLPALDPGKMLFSASDDGTIRLWDLSARTCVRQFEGHGGQVQSIQLSFAEEEEVLEKETTENDSAMAVDPPADGPSSKNPSSGAPVLISGALDNTIRIWDVATGKRIKTLFGHIQGVWAVASDKLRLASGSHDKTIKLWNRAEEKSTATLVGHRGPVTCLALGDDKIVSGSDDGDIRIWNFAGTP